MPRGEPLPAHPGPQPHGNGAWRPLFVLVVAATLVRAALLGRPFVADNEGTACGPLLCVVRNYLRYGPLVTGFGGIINTGTVPPDRWVIYAHHPPLVPLLIAGFQRIAGISESTARAVPSLFSVASAALLYLMAARRFGVRAAVAAGVLYTFCPLTLLFGGMQDYVGAQLVFFGLATIETYVRWVETGRTRWLAALTVVFFLGALTDWPIFYLVPALSGHYLLTRPRRGFVPLAPLLAAVSLLFVALVVWAQAVSAGREYWTATGGDFSVLHKLAIRTLGHPDSDATPLSVRMDRAVDQYLRDHSHPEPLVRRLREFEDWPRAFASRIMTAVKGVSQDTLNSLK